MVPRRCAVVVVCAEVAYKQEVLCSGGKDYAEQTLLIRTSSLTRHVNSCQIEVSILNLMLFFATTPTPTYVAQGMF